MHRAFGIDVLACAHCGGRLRLIATLHDPAVIRTILTHPALRHPGQSPGPAPPESGGAASWDGGHEGGARRRRALMLPILSGRERGSRLAPPARAEPE
jgi:hypothetical protein